MSRPFTACAMPSLRLQDQVTYVVMIEARPCVKSSLQRSPPQTSQPHKKGEREEQNSVYLCVMSNLHFNFLVTCCLLVVSEAFQKQELGCPSNFPLKEPQGFSTNYGTLSPHELKYTWVMQCKVTYKRKNNGQSFSVPIRNRKLIT